MADLKITQLASALSILDSNILVIDDGSNTMKTSAKSVKDYVIGTEDISAIGDGSVTGAITSVNSSIASKVGAVKVNGVSQTVDEGAVNLDVASNLITEAQWTSLSTLYAI